MKKLIISSVFLCLAAGIGGCGSDEPTPAPAAPTVAAPATPGAPAMPAAPAAPAVPAAPGVLALNGPPQPLPVPQVPSLNLHVAQAGEYQIDAMGRPMDAQLYVYQGTQRVDSNSDGGEGTDARIIRFLQPGNYSVRVYEYRTRPMNATVQAQLLTPMTPAGVIIPGQTLPVQVPQGDHPRAAAREVTLTIAVPGMYQIDATTDAEHDAQLVLIHNNRQLEANSDGGEGRNARIRRQLAPGTYQIRTYDWRRRATTINIQVTHDAAVAASPPAAPVSPPAGPPAPGAQLAVNGPPVPLQVPASPGFNMTLAAAGEYQIDAMGRPMDAQLYIYQGDQRIDSNSDSGEGTDARIIRFMQPGTYAVRVMEYRARAMQSQVQAQLLTPMTPAGVIVPGQTVPVQVPQGDHPRAASRELTLTIPAQGNYVINAVTDAEHDAQLMLIQNNNLLESNSDGGEGRNARITRALAPGTYTIRTYDWRRRATLINVTVTPQ